MIVLIETFVIVPTPIPNGDSVVEFLARYVNTLRSIENDSHKMESLYHHFVVFVLFLCRKKKKVHSCNIIQSKTTVVN